MNWFFMIGVMLGTTVFLVRNGGNTQGDLAGTTENLCTESFSENLPERSSFLP